jgi:crotonobetainyl-CoA:carnitine CoA-transferase CaiB-like acyl-CoA transferase
MARILDLAAHPGIYAGRLLAETGHDVIRVEPPGGDAIRRLGPYLGNEPGLERGAFHQFLNAGKRSLTLDVDAPAGLEVLDRLVATADAVIGSLPLSSDPARWREAHPRLVVVAIDDADDGPELCRYARSGLLSLTGHPGQTPMLMGGHVIYAATGLYVAVATAAALLVQDLTGQGQVVTVRPQDCMETFFEQAVATYVATGKGTERRGYRGAITAVSGAMPALDGYWMLSVSHTAERWAALMDWVQDPVLLADTSLADEANRGPKKDLILDRLERWARTLKKEEAVVGAQERHIPAAPVSNPMDLAEDPQLIARGFLKEAEHPDFGRILFPVGAIASLRDGEVRLAPRLGEHTRAILTELGYDPHQQALLFEQGTI